MTNTYKTPPRYLCRRSCGFAALFPTLPPEFASISIFSCKRACNFYFAIFDPLFNYIKPAFSLFNHSHTILRAWLLYHEQTRSTSSSSTSLFSLYSYSRSSNAFSSFPSASKILFASTISPTRSNDATRLGRSLGDRISMGSRET